MAKLTSGQLVDMSELTLAELADVEGGAGSTYVLMVEGSASRSGGTVADDVVVDGRIITAENF